MFKGAPPAIVASVYNGLRFGREEMCFDFGASDLVLRARTNAPLWGAGGHGKVVLDIARNCAQFESICFFDDHRDKQGTRFCGYAVVGGETELRLFAMNWFLVALGNNRARSRCFELASKADLKPRVLIHSSAAVSPSASIGAGTVIMPGAIINAGASIGQNCIINTGAIIEHDCETGAHVHISPRVVLGGGVIIHDYVHVGIGATILPWTTIGQESVVGAGAVVLKEVPADCTVMGIPAKTKSDRSRSENVCGATPVNTKTLKGF